jgi:signal transduction histidine kinase
MHNNEIKKLIVIELIIFICLIFVTLVLNYNIHNHYKKELIKNNTHIIAAIIKAHPELEEEIISNLISSSGDFDSAKQIMNKYGLDSISNLEYLTDIKNIKERITLYNFSFMIILFITISITYIVFVKKQYKKINSINKYMNNILNGDYSFDIREYQEGDISNLKNDIYKITVRLKEQSELLEKEKKHLENVLSDISHQIKTPLTSMYVINDLLTKDNVKPELKKEFLTKNYRQLERIEWLVTTLLKLSRLDSGSIVLKKEDVNIKNLITDAIAPFLIPMELKKQKVTISGDDFTKISADYNWTLEAIINIIKNAHEHTSSGGEITISYDTNPLYTEILIIDNGEGISKDDIKHIFKRFYRGTKSNKESIGIGLNMAKKIIDIQNGIISVKSEINKGTTFSIKIYKLTV